MNNSDDIFDLIDDIALNSSKNAKVQMLKDNDSDLLRRVLSAALDPLVTYGIAKLPDFSPREPGRQFNDWTWQVIDDMASRKLTGDVMRDTVFNELSDLTPDSAALFARIILKDLKAGFGDNTVNKAFPGLIREFPYMRCSLPKGDKLDKIDWSAGVISQEKADGMFVNVNHVAGGAVSIFSRAGSMFMNFAFGSLIPEITQVVPEDHQAHGELLVVRDGKVLPREEGNGMLNSVLSGEAFLPGCTPLLMLWDVIPLTAVKPKGRYEVPYHARLKSLVGGVSGSKPTRIKIIPTKVVKSKAEAYAHYRELLVQKKEGTIIKLPNAIWRDGTSNGQFKMKQEVTVDLRVLEIVPGDINGKNAGRAGSLRCATDDKLLIVDVAIKGEKMRDDVDMAFADKWLHAIMPVTANGITKPSDSNPNHSLFLPRFAESEPRTDKSVGDSLMRVMEQFEAAVK